MYTVEHVTEHLGFMTREEIRVWKWEVHNTKHHMSRTWNVGVLQVKKQKKKKKKKLRRRNDVNQAFAPAAGKNWGGHKDRGVEVLHSKPAGCVSEDKTVYRR
jgi:hypothetical protein